MSLMKCPECGREVSSAAAACPACGHPIHPTQQVVVTAPPPPVKSDGLAGCLGLLLGPVGLWYKGHWAAGFAWLVMAVLLGAASGGILTSVCWIGMAVHAMTARPKA
jgi:hypothetical protein